MSDAGHDVPDLNELDEQGINLTFFHGFPHYFVLPMYSSASAYRFRPLGPEETLMEIWSLARFPEGQEPATPTPLPPAPVVEGPEFLEFAVSDRDAADLAQLFVEHRAPFDPVPIGVDDVVGAAHRGSSMLRFEALPC